MKRKKCPFCPFSAKGGKMDGGKMARHIRNVHEKIRDKKCPFCAYASSQLDNLKRHIKSMHAKEVKEGNRDSNLDWIIADGRRKSGQQFGL
jgi:hypothetical protein